MCMEEKAVLAYLKRIDPVHIRIAYKFETRIILILHDSSCVFQNHDGCHRFSTEEELCSHLVMCGLDGWRYEWEEVIINSVL